MWCSTDLCHQLGTLNRQYKRFNNLPVGGMADAVTQALKLSSEGTEAYFACAEYQTPVSQVAANASGAYAFWVDIDCGEDKAAAGKGYSSLPQEASGISRPPQCSGPGCDRGVRSRG